MSQTSTEQASAEQASADCEMIIIPQWAKIICERILTDELAREKKIKSNLAYNKSEAGKKARAKYAASPKGIAARKGRKLIKSVYEASLARKASTARRQSTPEYKQYQKVYQKARYHRLKHEATMVIKWLNIFTNAKSSAERHRKTNKHIIFMENEIYSLCEMKTNV